MDKFDDFANNMPKLHSWDGGKTYNSGGLSTKVLYYIRKIVNDSSNGASSFIETGAGASTIACLLLGCDVTSIAPDKQLFDRIVAYCGSERIDTSRLTQIVDYSEFALPKISAEMRSRKQQVDFALIDGAHEYPAVFVDFCYINSILKKGGFLILDDLQLHPPKELARFVAGAIEYKIAENLSKTIIFQKLTDGYLMGNFMSNKFVVEKTEEYKRQRDPYLF